MRLRSLLAPLTVLTLLAAGTVATPAANAAPQTRSSYIVVLRDGAGDPATVASGHVRRFGGSVGYVYRSALRGFSVSVTADAAAALRRDSRVLSVEADERVTITAQTVPTGVRRIAAAHGVAEQRATDRHPRGASFRGRGSAWGLRCSLACRPRS